MIDNAYDRTMDFLSPAQHMVPSRQYAPPSYHHNGDIIFGPRGGTYGQPPQASQYLMPTKYNHAGIVQQQSGPRYEENNYAWNHNQEHIPIHQQVSLQSQVSHNQTGYGSYFAAQEQIPAQQFELQQTNQRAAPAGGQPRNDFALPELQTQQERSEVGQMETYNIFDEQWCESEAPDMFNGTSVNEQDQTVFTGETDTFVNDELTADAQPFNTASTTVEQEEDSSPKGHKADRKRKRSVESSSSTSSKKSKPESKESAAEPEAQGPTVPAEEAARLRRLSEIEKIAAAKRPLTKEQLRILHSDEEVGRLRAQFVDQVSGVNDWNDDEFRHKYVYENWIFTGSLYAWQAGNVKAKKDRQRENRRMRSQSAYLNGF